MQIRIDWRSVKGYDGFYEVSAQGIVRSKDRVINLPGGKTRKIKGKIIVQKKNNDGYPFVTLSKDGKPKTVYIHRAVAGAFLENAKNLPEVNHLDGNKCNNNVDNLAWVTHQQNVQHCYDIGLCKNKGGNHTFAVGVIDNFLGQEFATIKEWAAARGVNYSTGRNVLKGCNKSKMIDLAGIVLVKKVKNNDNG